MRKTASMPKDLGKLFTLFTAFVLMTVACGSNAHASIYLTGASGGGMQTYVGAPPGFDNDTAGVPAGLFSYYDRAIRSAASGNDGVATSSASISFSVNADSLGWIENDTTGEFSIEMLGSVIRPYGNTWATSNNDFQINFSTTSYYQYDFSGTFTNYSDGSGRSYLRDMNTLEDLYSAVSDAAHSETGSSTGILAPGNYQFGSALMLTLFSSGVDLVNANRLIASLQLTPTVAAVPVPGTWILLGSGLLALSIRKRMLHRA